MRKLILMYVLIGSLILPGMSGFAAENNSIESLNVEDYMSAADIMVSEEEEIVSEDGIVSLEDEAEDTEQTGDCLVLSIEELESFEDIVEIPVVTDETVVTEEVIEMHRVSESGLASSANLSDFSIYSIEEYSGSYGAQLSGDGVLVYNAMANAFLTEKSAETFEVIFNKPYKFAVEDQGYDQGEHLWNRQGAEYLAAASEIKYYVQSAYDAFLYDNPRAFWVTSFSYSWVITLYLDKEGRYTEGTISSIQITPEERYTGAASEINAFDEAVDTVASEIARGLSENADVIEIIEEIHDWLCFNVEYQENSYAHTAAGVFLKDRKVVCEGYAKAFDILCDEFGIESVLIAGGAKKRDGSIEGHMWNYVNINGSWYMIDTTWDDQKSYISKQYFLAGNSSMGFNEVICDERILYTRFSPSGTEAHSFVLPILNESAYSGAWHEWNTVKKIDIEPTCVLEGSRSYHCRKCSVSMIESVEEIQALGHDWENEYTIDQELTCEQNEQKSYHCSRCDIIQEGTIITTQAPGHDWENEYTIDQELTCEQNEQKSYHCSRCDMIQEGSIAVTPALGHDWDGGTVTLEATCAKPGQLTYVCKICKDEKYDEIAALEHSYGEWKVTKAPGCETAGVKSRFCVCGNEETEEIAETGHTWEKEYTVDKQMTCEQDGQKSYHCEVCDAVNESSTVIIEASGHSWDNGTVTIEATCTKSGQRMYVCEACKAEEYDEIAVAAHSYREWKVTKAPGCETTGVKSRFCVCGDEKTEEIPETGHTWNRGYSTDRIATCTAYGIKSIHCSECDNVRPDSYIMADRLDVSFTADALVMKMGQKTNKLKVSGLTGGDYIKSWSSSNKKIIGVTKKGRITAKKQTGTAFVIITLANDKYGTTRQYRIPVSVQEAEVKTEQISGLQKKLIIRKGETYALQPVLVPITSSQGLTYTSGKPGVASVSAKGVITAKAAGKTKITVRSGNKKFVVTVNVPKTVTEKIKARQKVSVKAGKSVMLKVKLTPVNSDQKLRFVSKNRKIADVDQNGKITGKKKGKTKIVVKSGTVTHTCTVTVK